MEEIQNTSIGNLIEPEAIAYSFNTLGWYIVFGVLILTAILVFILQIRKYRKNKYRRTALLKIAEVLKLSKQNKRILELNKILKIVAIKVFGRETVASLFGKEWFDFLVSTCLTADKLPIKNIENYSVYIYNNDIVMSEKDFNEFVSFAKFWIKNHTKINV